MSLIITITVMAIIAGISIQNGLQRTDDAKRAKHNTNISIAQEEVQSYYYYKNGELPALNLTPYTVTAGSTLEAEIIKNGEKADIFYVLDLSKLSKVNGTDGTGVGDDIYIVSATRHNVYHVKGTRIKGIVYHGLITNNSVRLAEVTPISSGTSSEFDGTVNKPRLAAGMTPVKWDSATSKWVNAESSNVGNDWYDYTKGIDKWANAKLKDGSLLVWIPRYTYNITPDPDTAADRSIHGNIDIKFSNGTRDDTSDEYKIHPAFYWGGWNIPLSGTTSKIEGGTELTGIWVGKFETSRSGGKFQIKTNIWALTSITVNDMFIACKNLKNDSATYGDLSIADTHMLKNSEWGAVAYLSKYILGSTEVAINSNTSDIIANGDIVANKDESTNGNEYGIYDMSGGTRDYMATYVDDISADTYGHSLYAEPEKKYKDIFPKSSSNTAAGNYAGLNKAYGHAIYETSNSYTGITGWFGDITYMAKGTDVFITRGGMHNHGSQAGLFAFYSYSGNIDVEGSFRISIAIP